VGDIDLVVPDVTVGETSTSGPKSLFPSLTFAAPPPALGEFVLPDFGFLWASLFLVFGVFHRCSLQVALFPYT
jgi:hypothetical protein